MSADVVLPASAGSAGITFASRWAEAVQQHGERTFLVFRAEGGEVTSWTYSDFGQIVDEVVAFLGTIGVRRGDSIHVCLRNCPAFVALWLAAAQHGAWIVPVDPASTTRDLVQQIERTRPVLGICATSRSEVYRAASGRPDFTVMEVEEDANDLRSGGRLRVAPTPAHEADETTPMNRLAVMFTSGTTSQPKGVVLTQANYAHVARVMAEAVDLTAEDRWLVTLPLFHANAQYYCFAPAIHTGASVALTATFSASRWVTVAKDLHATHASLFAAPIRMILARTPEGTTPAALRHVWFAQSLGAEHHRAFGALAGCLPRQLYGMTETVAIVTADRSDPPQHDVIGHPVDDRAVRLVDPATETPVGPGTPGMIMVGGRRGLDLFLEYLGDPTTTQRSFSDFDESDHSWFLTGDLAQANSDGSLRFVGRADDVIKVAGENVSLTEVEAALAQAPGVLEVAVLGQADPVRDQVPVAYVVPRNPEQPPRPEDLVAWAVEHLSPQSRPRAWHIIEALPRTSVGKVRRFKIANTD